MEGKTDVVLAYRVTRIHDFIISEWHPLLVNNNSLQERIKYLSKHVSYYGKLFKECIQSYMNIYSSSSYYYYYYYYYMALQPISGLGLLFMRFLNLTLIDNW
jgi:hypothetical protein